MGNLFRRRCESLDIGPAVKRSATGTGFWRGVGVLGVDVGKRTLIKAGEGLSEDGTACV